MRRIFLVLTGLLFLTTLPSHAHEGRPVHIEVSETVAGEFQLRWKIPPVLRGSEIPTIRLSGTFCSSVAERAPSLVGSALYRCSDERRPDSVALTFPGFNPALSTLVILTLADGESHTLLSGPEQTIIGLPGPQSFADTAAQYTYAGFDHILEGFDHLLFVFCLILLVGSPGRILWAVTGFTIGHSITLGLTALYELSLPPTFIEPLIVLSIVMLAAEKLTAQSTPDARPTLAARYPAIIASGFGLLHGFGFGGALAEIGLPYSYKITALAFFNIGVELGQVAFILAVLMLAKLLQLTKHIMPGLPGPAQMANWMIYPAGLVAGYWSVERIAGIWI